MVGAKPYGQLQYRNVNGKRMAYGHWRPQQVSYVIWRATRIISQITRIRRRSEAPRPTTT
jgi:hypothetical protein